MAILKCTQLASRGRTEAAYLIDHYEATLR